MQPITSARPYPHLAESHVRRGVLNLVRFASPFYLRMALGFRSVRITHAERLLEAYRAFFERKLRFIIAFRHPYGDEAQLMTYAILRLLDREARARGSPLSRKAHAHFVHGYEVPLWSGPIERWLLPRVGAVPVYHTKFDAKSIGQIRALMLNGEYPLSLAPEGQVSYSSDRVPRLEAGAARIALWCADDIARRKTGEQVAILPVSIFHHWERDAEPRLDRLIDDLERQCGLPRSGAAPRTERLSAAADAMLEMAEHWYARFYGYETPQNTASRAQRLAGVREAALSAAEHVLRIRPEGDEIRRVYRIRQACWDRIYREDIPERKTLSALASALADRIAGEAWLASRHMELVDLTYYLDLDRLREYGDGAPLDLLCETAQNFRDLASRLQGGNISDRASIRGKIAHIDVGEAILAEPARERSGSSKKAAMESLTGELARAYETSIREYRLGARDGAG